MKRRFLAKFILITAAAVLCSNLIQYVWLSRTSGEQTAVTDQRVYENKDSIFTNYANGILNTYRFLLELGNGEYSSPNEVYLLLHGYLMGSGSEVDAYLAGLIRNMDGSEYHHELGNILDTNLHLQAMIYTLEVYFSDRSQDPDFPDNWEKIKVLLTPISAQLSSGSSNDMTLYNITSYPQDFAARSEYPGVMASLNKEISEAMDLLEE
ncbi:hypothetical protein [Paenibacillus physcomitrellae]|uniref:Uncharacterized protein n=1 Tax=Paenibacillus physcomitrellae TaxID=1619311 RepID=A0ABQ1GGS1_9BACL|nr:hypothetical protein [Paenibacillus physcomitrellae]GGA43359.1 hypothetical protein GCM10010917_30830 [Paenibacillus physcomitrellae]